MSEKTIKPVSELQTAQDFYDFFEAIPEEKWTVNTFSNGDKCCAAGHLGAPEEIAGWDRLDSFARRLGYEYSHFVNDGDAGAYQQPTPKARILAMLSDAIAKGL